MISNIFTAFEKYKELILKDLKNVFLLFSFQCKGHISKQDLLIKIYFSLNLCFGNRKVQILWAIPIFEDTSINAI